MGGGARSVIVWGIVSIVILLVSYLLIVKPILDDTDEQIDRAFQQSEQLQESIQEDADQSLGQAQGGRKEKGGEEAGVAP